MGVRALDGTLAVALWLKHTFRRDSGFRPQQVNRDLGAPATARLF